MWCRYCKYRKGRGPYCYCKRANKAREDTGWYDGRYQFATNVKEFHPKLCRPELNLLGRWRKEQGLSIGED